MKFDWNPRLHSLCTEPQYKFPLEVIERGRIVNAAHPESLLSSQYPCNAILTTPYISYPIEMNVM